MGLKKSLLVWQFLAGWFRDIEYSGLSACAILESVVVLGKRSPSCLAIGLGMLDISGGGWTRSSSLGGDDRASTFCTPQRGSAAIARVRTYSTRSRTSIFGPDVDINGFSTINTESGMKALISLVVAPSTILRTSSSAFDRQTLAYEFWWAGITTVRLTIIACPPRQHKESPSLSSMIPAVATMSCQTGSSSSLKVLRS